MNRLDAFIEEEKVRISDISPVDGDCYANMKAKKGRSDVNSQDNDDNYDSCISPIAQGMFRLSVIIGR